MIHKTILDSQLLTPLRAPAKKSLSSISSRQSSQQQMNLGIGASTDHQTSPQTATSPPPDFAPDSLEADKCSVRLYVGKGTAFVYGTLIRSFLHLKENLFGEDQGWMIFSDADVSFLSFLKLGGLERLRESRNCARQFRTPYSRNFLIKSISSLDLTYKNVQIVSMTPLNILLALHGHGL